MRAPVKISDFQNPSTKISLFQKIDRHFGTKSLKRKALTKPNIAYLRWRYVGNRDRTLKAWSHHVMYAESRSFAEALKRFGITMGPSAHYLDQDGTDALAQASKHVFSLSRSESVQARILGKSSARRKDYCIRLIGDDEEHAPNSPLLLLALDRKLLEIVSLYLGMWPRLNAIGAWLNYPTPDAPKESQLWHRDPEDVQIIKVFIYLNDVDENLGPFCYIPTTHPFGSRAAILPTHVDSSRVTDDEMLAVIPEELWLTCAGPSNTMILADTVGYHRGGKPRVGNRLLITFTYTSGTPMTKRSLNFPDDQCSWSAMQRYAVMQ